MCLICGRTLGPVDDTMTLWLLFGYQCVIMNWKPAFTSQGHMITILIQSVFFSVRSSELNGAGPAVPTSCGNWPSDRYAVTYDCKRIHTHTYSLHSVSLYMHEMIFVWICVWILLASWWLMAVGGAVSLDSRLELFLCLCPGSLLMI